MTGPVDRIPADTLAAFRRGVVIPATPLALDENRRFDEVRQRALTRYYVDAGAGGLAVGVHSTQFKIRDPDIGLFEPVLSLVSETVDEWAGPGHTVFKIAGVCGKRAQAEHEAEFARSAGYHAILLSLAALKEANVPELIEHCRAVAEIMPVVGFYLQPAAGGRVLPYSFWREFAALESVVGIKVAPFDRYATLDVVRAVAETDTKEHISLYTGNDDNIVADLLTTFRFGGDEQASRRIVGGLLGHWAVWTKPAAALVNEIHAIVESGCDVPSDLLRRGVEITDANAAFFDAANGFAGCIPGIHEVLRRQGLLRGTWCLNPDEVLSPGQNEEIDRVYAAYPHLNDDTFVRENLDRWLAQAGTCE